MSKPVVDQKTQGMWDRNDPRLIRVAQKLIRLYDGESAGPFWIKAESIAALIADGLNHSADDNP
jgi:hypothetical protein